MKIEKTITTKFGVGQRVWRIHLWCVYKKCKSCNRPLPTPRKWEILGPATITGIEVNLDWRSQDEYYDVARTAKPPYRLWSPSELFLTKLEATAECDRRNAE